MANDMRCVPQITMQTSHLRKCPAGQGEAAEKVPLYMLISCNYILIVAGFFIPLSY